MKLFTDVSLEIQHRIAKDMKFSLGRAKNGNTIINWDMDESTHDFLQGYAAAKRLTYDELMGRINMAILAVQKAYPDTFTRALFKAAKKN